MEMAGEPCRAARRKGQHSCCRKARGLGSLASGGDIADGLHFEAAQGFQNASKIKPHRSMTELNERDLPCSHEFVHHPRGWYAQVLGQLLFGEEAIPVEGTCGIGWLSAGCRFHDKRTTRNHEALNSAKL